MNKTLILKVNPERNLLIKCGDSEQIITNNTLNADSLFKLLNFEVGDTFEVAPIDFDDDEHKDVISAAKMLKKFLDDLVVKINQIELTEDVNTASLAGNDEND